MDVDLLTILTDAPATLPAGDTPTSRIQVAVAGEGFRDPRYGEFAIRTSDFDAWQRNLSALPGGQAMIDLDHVSERGGSSEAAGWITKLDRRGKDGSTDTPKELWATVEWTPPGAQAVRERRYRFFSPVYGAYRDEQGNVTPNVLKSGALTNRPFLRRGMAAVTLSAALPAEIDREDDDTSLDAYVDQVCTHLNAESVGPDARKKLSGLIRHYMAKPHPFTACVRDNTKRFGPERAERVCATLKDIGAGTTRWRNGGDRKLDVLGGLVDRDDLVALCESVDQLGPSDSRRRMEITPDMLKALSLDENADEAKVLEAVNALAARPEQTGDDTRTLAEHAAAEGKVVLSEDTFSGMQTRLTALEAGNGEREFEDAYSKALSNVQVDSKDETKALWQEQHKAAPEATLKLLAALPKLARTEAAGATGETGDTPDGVYADSHLLDQKVQARMAEKGETYDVALTAVSAEAGA